MVVEGSAGGGDEVVEDARDVRRQIRHCAQHGASTWSIIDSAPRLESSRTPRDLGGMLAGGGDTVKVGRTRQITCHNARDVITWGSTVPSFPLDNRAAIRAQACPGGSRPMDSATQAAMRIDQHMEGD